MMDNETRDANRRAAWRWGSLVVGLLSLQVIGGVFAILLATGDESVAIVPDYHQKALHWDDEMALQRASQELGWICDVSQIDEAAETSGLRLSLTDRSGDPIELHGGELRFYRHARASHVRRIPIPAGPLVSLQLSGCFDADGLWEVMIDVTDRDGNRFAHSSELTVTTTTIAPEMDHGSVAPARIKVAISLREM